MSAYARSAILQRTTRPNTPRNSSKIFNRFTQDENEGTETQLNTHDPYQFSQISFMEQNSSTNKSISEEKKIQDNNFRNPYKVMKTVQSNRMSSKSLSQVSYRENSANNAACNIIQMSQNSTNVSTLTEENYFSLSQSQRKNSNSAEEVQKTSATNIKQEKQQSQVIKRPWMSTCMDMINPYRRNKRIKQQSFSIENSEDNEKKYLEYNEADSNKSMSKALVIGNNATPVRATALMKTPTRFDTQQEEHKRNENVHKIAIHNNQERQILEAQHKENQELMTKLQEQGEKGNRELMAKIEEQGDYMKNMNRFLENQEGRIAYLEEKVKNITMALYDQEKLMTNQAKSDEEIKETINKLQGQSQCIENSIAQILEFQKLTANHLNAVRENDNSSLLDNIATNQVELSKKQDDLFRHTLDQGEKQKKVLDELSEKLVQSIKGMREFFDDLSAKLISHLTSNLNEKLHQVAEEIKDVANTIKGQIQSILTKIEDNRKIDSSNESKDTKNTCITPPSSIGNQYDDSQSHLKFSHASLTPEMSNRNTHESTSIVKPQPLKLVSVSVSASACEKKKDYDHKIIKETPVDDPNDLISDALKSASCYSSSKRNASMASLNAASSATYSKKIARPLDHSATKASYKKKSSSKADPLLGLVITNDSIVPEKQVRRSKRLKQSGLVKKPAKKKVSIQIPEIVKVKSSSENKKPATKVMTKSASRGEMNDDNNKKFDVTENENSEDTFCFHSQPESSQKRTFLSMARPSALLSFFSPSKKTETPAYGTAPKRKKRRMNLNTIL